jgi:hypothetical protein
MRRLLTVLAALCLLALPPAALAQSAGDEQYADPFGQVDESNGSKDQPAQTPAAAPAAPAQSDAAPADSQAEVAQQTSAPTLPATGFPAGLLAAAGGLLLASGATLRRRVS